MNKTSSQTTAAWPEKLSRLRLTPAIVPGSGFHHVLIELRVEKSPLRCGRGWIKVDP